MINIDKADICYCSIDTEAWLTAVLGEPVEDYESDSHWIDEESIKDYLLSKGYETVSCTNADNTYNSANDFCSNFIFQAFTTSDTEDKWYWQDDVYIAIQVHLGGDVRGNYGDTRLYKLPPYCTEKGLFDWVLEVEVIDSEGESLGKLNVGYSSHPLSCIDDSFDSVEWSTDEEAYVATLGEETFTLDLNVNAH
jgi:hypothetical protein